MEEIDDLCWEIEFSEKLVEHPDIKELIIDIDNYCASNRIIGYHYTRAFPEQIGQRGLLVRSGQEIREGFIESCGQLFSESEILDIKAAWNNYYDDEKHGQPQVRDYRIFFNFTQAAIEKSGAEPLLNIFGGEQISMCFDADSSIGKKLSSLGEPLILRCTLDPENLKTFIEHPWGQIVVSSYHLSKNPGAYRIDQDGYQSITVPPEDIEIHKAPTSNSSPTGYAALHLRLS